MTNRTWLLLATAGLLGAGVTGPLGCSSDDDTSTPTTTTATGSGTHTGGQGGAGGGQGGNQGGGGTGGGVSAVQEFCDAACPASVACGQGGGGGASGSWPPTLEDCMTGCVPIWEDCDAADLATAAACLEPNIDPNCDMDALMTCVANLTCVAWPGSGGGNGGTGGAGGGG